MTQYAANTLAHHWMPFTCNRDFKSDPRLLVRGEGIYYWSHEGRRIIDATSGLFCCSAGHGRHEITQAVTKQLMEMDYAPSFQVGHPASFELARRIAAITPDGLNHVFFANSGSDAVDSALKIAMAYHCARGEGQRLRFVSRERSYHGMNIGGTSPAGLMKNREACGAVMPGVVHMRHTRSPENNFIRGQPETGVEYAEDLQRFVDLLGGRNIAACCVEPLVGTAGGILVPPKGYLERLREICDQNCILLIFDEVLSGFGRTGKAFAAQSFGVTPDLIVMGKAMTNGVLPMSAVAVSETIYETVTGAAPEGQIELFQGYTHSGSPVPCAAALATLDIYEKERLFDRAAKMSPYPRIRFRARGSARSDRNSGLRNDRRLRPGARGDAGGTRLRGYEAPVRGGHTCQVHRRFRDRGAAANRGEK